MPAPGAPALDPTTAEPGDTLAVTWPGYTCPAGEGSVSEYTVTVTNGTLVGGPSFGADVRSAQVTAGDSGTVIVTYTATCTGGPSQSRTSPVSPEATATIQAPEPTPTPTP